MPTDRIVGIDLGTTNSLVAFMQGETPVVIPGEDGLNLVPSVVALDEHGQIIVGSAARKYLIETPERAVYSIKRLMGRGVEDVQEELKLFPFRLAEDLQPGEVLRIKSGDKSYTPPEISAFILRQLKRNAERYFGGPVTKAVITVPAYFNDAQRKPRKTPAASRGWKFFAWSTSRQLRHSPTVSTKRRTASWRSTTWAAAPSTFRFSSSTTVFSKSSRPTATRIWAATTLTTCSSTSRSMIFAATWDLTCAAAAKAYKPSARP
jgi:hypothetical protein